MKRAYIYAGISVLLWSSLATVSKVLLESMNSFQVLCISSLVGFLALLVFNLIKGNMKKLGTFTLKDVMAVILIGLPGTFLYYALYYLGAQRMPASQAFIINYLWPIMSVVFACILLKEQLTLRKGLAIGLSFLGVITVAGEDLIQFNMQALIGGAFCLVAAVSYGAFTVFMQKWPYDKSLSLMISFLVSFVLSGSIAFFQDVSWQLSAGQWLGASWNGLAVMAIATITWALALEKGGTLRISGLAYITPFLSLVWTGLFLKESISLWTPVGLCIIVLGIFLQLKKE